jgi:type II secretory pathway component PulK
MWVIVILAAMVLIFSRSMRVELAASSNRLSVQQAATLELGAEQYVLSAVDGCDGDAAAVLATPAEQQSLGDGYFWILQTYPNDNRTYAFGITDENSKLNLNYATDAMLMMLPGMQQGVADSIVKWTGSNGPTQGQGADGTYYATLPRPYTLKAAPFETVEELYLLQNVTDTLMFGNDLDHNGMIDGNELGNGTDALAASFNAANDTGRGIFPFVTVWGSEPNTYGNATPRVNLALINATALRSALSKLPDVSQIMTRFVRPPYPRFPSIFSFARYTGLNKKPTELSQVAYHLTTKAGPYLPGMVNINTAPPQVLMCLPGLTSDDANNIVAQRPSTSGTGAAGGLGGAVAGAASMGSGPTSPTDYTWIMNVGLATPKLDSIGAYITGRSYFYSADIVAVSGDGRGFKRARIVVDGRSSPPVIVYRKDLTNLGWPLSPDILDALKHHRPLPAASGAMGTGSTNGLSSLLGQ